MWPVSSDALTMCGYFHRMSWLCEKPCDETISLSCTDHCSAQTCECVSTALTNAPLLVFQKRIMRSAVPPPEASRFFCHGHHARALTAAWCWSKLKTGGAVATRRSSQIFSRLSLPPEASCTPPGAHLSPQTSCWCPCSVATECCACRRKVSDVGTG